MPWEETDEYIRSGHREPSDQCRTTTLSVAKGIKAVVCKYGEKWEIQSYLFSKKHGWTLDKAKDWFGQHQQENVAIYHYSIVTPIQIVESLMAKPLRVKGVALTVGASRNFNIYTPEELQAFANKLVSAPVYIEHVRVGAGVGKVVKTSFDGENLFYEAEIYDDEVASLIKLGIIQHVSIGADYETIDVVDGQIPRGLHNAELSLVAVAGVPQANIAPITESLSLSKINEISATLESLAKLALQNSQAFMKFKNSVEERFSAMVEENKKRITEAAKTAKPQGLLNTGGADEEPANIRDKEFHEMSTREVMTELKRRGVIP